MGGGLGKLCGRGKREGTVRAREVSGSRHCAAWDDDVKSGGGSVECWGDCGNWSECAGCGRQAEMESSSSTTREMLEACRSAGLDDGTAVDKLKREVR